VYSNASADVFDMDGLLLTFDTQEEARNYLLEDEYVSMDGLTDDDYAELGMQCEQLVPPISPSDAELVPKMLVMRG
jgi:hypothetical protein